MTPAPVGCFWVNGTNDRRLLQRHDAAARARFGVCPMGQPWVRCPTCGYPLRWDLARCARFACSWRPRHDGPARYASRTGTVRNLRELAQSGWRLLAAPDHLGRYRDPVPPWRFGLDNGAWSARGGGTFDAAAFERSVDAIGGLADWIVLPDVVCGGPASLDLSLSWLPRLEHLGVLLLLPVQDGMEIEQIRPLIGPQVGLFVGGSTAWKEATMATWAALAREQRAYVHVGRVNTRRRIALCVSAGVDSFDGTSATVYARNARPLAEATADLAAQQRAQGTLWGAP